VSREAARHALLALGLLALASCTYRKEQALCVVPETVSFAEHVQPLFTTHCALAGCHAGGAPTGNLNLEAGNAYAALTKAGSGYVDTVTPAFSLLYAQMNSASNPMPPTGKLEECSLNTVLRWIEQKAANN
jgi:hypothetical protein